MKYNNEKLIVRIRREELYKERRENKIYNLLIGFFIITLLIVISLTIFNWSKITGYVNSISSQAGYITSVTIYSKTNTTIWGGLYGLALRVPGFTQQLFEDLNSGTVERTDVFFDCLKTDAQGGPEIYVSTNPSLVISAGTVAAGSVSTVDSYIGCSGEIYCANNTYTNNMTIYVGSTQITGIPSTHTYKFNASNNIFDIGVLNISGSLAFVSHVNASIQKGFNPNALVNYQMLLPTPANTTVNYYFYSDPNDVCPSGGIGSTIDSTVSGYTKDSNGNILGDVSVTFVGNTTTSNSTTGFYNISYSVLEGTFNLIGQKSGYDTNISNVIINSSDYIVYKNISLKSSIVATENNSAIIIVRGIVKDTGGTTISGANISAGDSSTLTNSSGQYYFSPLLVRGTQPIISVKADYDNYVGFLTVNSTTSIIDYNITMEPANLNQYLNPPTEAAGVDAAGTKTEDETSQARTEAEKAGQDFWISAAEINKQIRENTFVEEKISIYNFKSGGMNIVFSIIGEQIEDIIKIDKSALSIGSNTFDSVILTIYGTKQIGTYKGKLKITGDLDVEVPVNIEIVPKRLPVETLVMEIELFEDSVNIGDDLKYRLNLQNLLTDQGYKVKLKHLIYEYGDSNKSQIIAEENEEVEIKNSLSLIKEFDIKNVSDGKYLVSIEAEYLGLYSNVASPFEITRPIYLYSFFGIPLWIIFIIISAFSFILLNLFIYKRQAEKKKRYHLALRLDTLPKPGERSIKLGKIAEKNIDAFYNMDDLTTHAIVAGATGGGKSIAAQVFVEEMLLKGIAVIVFDPTAQWSGMLRKCDDKRMMSFYPKFGLKPSDAKAFPGNVRQITNYLESLDINKYVNPGQIQVFTMNKMEPKQIDIFVAGVISNIFKSDPKEFPGLRVILVFDEVHRLLPKFGGSGKGFLQIERACREFRKWGLGVMLVSQVLSDFVGEIKANINTECLMRAAEEKDLERIKERYGLDALKSLVRADVGTAMLQNAEYNKGLPYFVNLRPILHNTRRLSDEVLDKYNQYNDTIDDLDYQIQQLEQEKIDIFDLKMELKLVKDKLMTGNFTVVDIYLEGLKPRVEKNWQTIGKQPKKRELKLIDVAELESALAKANAEKLKWQAQNAKTEEAKQEKAIDKGAIIVKPITFDNGLMVSSLNELKDVMPTFDDSVFKIHVNDNKNDIADWIGKEIDADLGKKVKDVKTKQEIMAIIQNFGKEVKAEEVKKDEVKKEEVKK